jgi:hypothetical protein
LFAAELNHSAGEQQVGAEHLAETSGLSTGDVGA